MSLIEANLVGKELRKLALKEAISRIADEAESFDMFIKELEKPRFLENNSLCPKGKSFAGLLREGHYNRVIILCQHLF